MLGRNTHFTLGVHLLTTLAVKRRVNDSPCPSAELARSVDSNPAFLRQLIGNLKDAGLVTTRLGKGGGALLAKDPRDITLLDVYRVTDGETRVQTHELSPQSSCPVACSLGPMFKDLGHRLDDVIANELSQVSIADLANSAWPAPGHGREPKRPTKKTRVDLPKKRSAKRSSRRG